MPLLDPQHPSRHAAGESAGSAASMGAERVRAIAMDLELRAREMSLAGAEVRLAGLEIALEQALAALSDEAARAG